MSALGISGIGPGLPINPLQQRYDASFEKTETLKTQSPPGLCQQDQTNLSWAARHPLQQTFAESRVAQTALDSARALNKQFDLIQKFLQDMQNKGSNTTWVNSAKEFLEKETRSFYGGEVVEKQSFLEQLLEDFKNNNSDTSWVVNLAKVLHKELEKLFGSQSQDISLNAKNSPLLNALGGDEQNPVAVFMKQLETYRAQFNKDTNTINHAFQSLLKEVTFADGNSTRLDNETAEVLASEVLMQSKNGQATAETLHGHLSATRTLALLQSPR